MTRKVGIGRPWNRSLWDGRPSVDVVEFKLFKYPETMLTAFQRGDIDGPYNLRRGVSRYSLPKLLKKPGIGLMVSKSGGWDNAPWINNSRSPLNQKGSGKR